LSSKNFPPEEDAQNPRHEQASQADLSGENLPEGFPECLEPSSRLNRPGFNLESGKTLDCKRQFLAKPESREYRVNLEKMPTDTRLNSFLTRPRFSPGKSDLPALSENLKELSRTQEKTIFILSSILEKKSQDINLSLSEKRALKNSLNSLLTAQGQEEVLSNTLHLARLCQHLRYIEEAKRLTKLASEIAPHHNLVHTLLKELERVQSLDMSFAPAFASTEKNYLTKANLASRILALSGARVMVVGDLLIDELVEGRPERISREAPVLILEHVTTSLIPGGAANTAHNVTALGGKCHTVGVCGDDEYAPKLAKVLEDHGITHALIKDAKRPTTVKSRVISKSHSLMQQLLRIDRISHEKISPELEETLIQQIESATSNCDTIILSDYKSGVITDRVIEAVRKFARERKTMVIVDAQNSFERFHDCALITPNQPDAEAYTGIKISDKASLEALGEKLLAKVEVQALLLTRGGDGMTLFERGKKPVELPAFNRSEVFDVTGAGDTVVATMALALTSGANLAEAMALGNLAASIVVRKPGTAVTSQTEMLLHLSNLNLPED
jgi:rfaE bifunctional protein kinase chain/domain